MDCAGVVCVLPPKGTVTLPAPTVLSKRSHQSPAAGAFQAGRHLPEIFQSGLSKCGAVYRRHGNRRVLRAPLVSRNAREISAMVCPFQRMTIRGLSVMTATRYASKFSSPAAAMTAPRLPGTTTTAMRSWLSEMASSVPSRPSYFLRTASRSMRQAVGQLADGHGHAAGAEVVAALDQAGHVAAAEQPLDLALLRGVALLAPRRPWWPEISCCGSWRSRWRRRCRPGRCGRPAGSPRRRGGDAPGRRLQREPRPPRRRIQTLGDVALMVDLGHVAGGQTDLVAVGGVARGGGLGQLALGQLALQRLTRGARGRRSR